MCKDFCANKSRSDKAVDDDDDDQQDRHKDNSFQFTHNNQQVSNAASKDPYQERSDDQQVPQMQHPNSHIKRHLREEREEGERRGTNS